MPLDIPTEHNTGECRIVGVGIDVAAFSFQFTLPRGTQAGSGTFECDLKHFVLDDGREFLMDAQPSDPDTLEIEGEAGDPPARPETITRRRVTAIIGAGGYAVEIGPLYVTHIAPIEVARPADSTMARVSVFDRRIFWSKFGGVTLRANAVIPNTGDTVQLDPNTLNGDEAWTVADLLSLLLTKIGEDDGTWALNATVGKPAVWTRGSIAEIADEILSPDFPPAGEVDWRAQESAFARLSELLDRFQLEIIVPPSGAVRIVRRHTGDLPNVAPDLVIENEVQYQNERVARAQVYVLVGEPIAIVRKYANMVPVLVDSVGTVHAMTSDANVANFGVTLGQIKKGAFEGGHDFFGGEWGFVTDSTGKTALASGDVAEIEGRKNLLRNAYRLWQIPNVAPGSANALDLPLFENSELASSSDDFDLARPQPPQVFGQRPINIDLFSGGGFQQTAAADQYVGGRVTVADARLGIIQTEHVIGAATLPSASMPTAVNGVVMAVAATSGITARVAHPKRGGNADFSSLDNLSQRATEIGLGGRAGVREGDPILDLTFMAAKDPDADLFFPDDPIRVKYISIPGLQLILALNDDGDEVETSNRLAVEAVADKYLTEFISRDNIYQSVTRRYAVPLPISPNGLIDSVSWRIDEPGGDGATTEISAGDLTLQRARPRAVSSKDALSERLGGVVGRLQYEALLRRVKPGNGYD